MAKCTCRVCMNHRRWLAAINPQTREAKAALDEILTNLEGAETDAVFWRMKFQGTWGMPATEPQKPEPTKICTCKPPEWGPNSVTVSASDWQCPIHGGLMQNASPASGSVNE
jgi:hypothetical protein